MDDREKLIKLLHEANHEFDIGCDPVKPYSHVLADHLIAHGVVVREDGCEVCSRHVPPGANYCWKCGRPLR